MYTDPIADMLTRIRNAARARKQSAVLPYSKFKASLAEVLVREGFLESAGELEGEHRMLEIKLKYAPEGSAVLSGIKRVSSPGQRIYLPAARVPRTNSGLGVTIISTSKGLLTDKDARKQGVGGEIVCQVW